jgi:hypothetical protein
MDKIEKDKLEGKYDFNKHDYDKFGTLPKCDRVTLFHEAQYVAEHIPFCSQPNPDPKTVEMIDPNGRKRSVENFERFNYPNKKLLVNKPPKWGFFMKNSVISESVKDKLNEELKSKCDEIKQHILDKNKNRTNVFDQDLRSSYIMVRDYKKVIGPTLVKVNSLLFSLHLFRLNILVLGRLLLYYIQVLNIILRRRG